MPKQKGVLRLRGITDVITDKDTKAFTYLACGIQSGPVDTVLELPLKHLTVRRVGNSRF